MASEKDPLPRKPGETNPVPPADDAGEAFVDFGATAKIHEGASGVIPLADLPEPPSSQSLSSWTEVIRRQRAASQVAESNTAPAPIALDAPSDRDLLSKLLEAEQDRQTGNSPLSRQSGDRQPDTDQIPQAEIPVIIASDELPGEDQTGNSSFNLRHLIPPEAVGPLSGGSEVRFDIARPPSDAGGVIPAAVAVDPGDSSQLPYAAEIDEADLGGLPVPGNPAETSRSSILDVLLNESVGAPGSSVLGKTDAPPARRMTEPGERAPVATDPSIEIPDSRFPPKIPTPVQSGSGWDVTPDSAADLEIGADDSVDLYADSAPAPSITDSGSLAISDKAVADARRRAEAIESSSVDLSSRPSMHESQFEMAMPGNTPLPADGRRGGDYGRADMRGQDPQGPGSASGIRPRDNQDAEQAALAAELEQRRRARQSGSQPRPNLGGKKKGGGVLIGTAVGLVLGVGGAAGAYFGGLLPKPEGTDQSAEVAQLRQRSDRLETDAANYKKLAEEAGQEKTTLTQAKSAAEKQHGDLVKQLQNAGIRDVGKAESTIKSLTETAVAADKKQKELTEMLTKANANVTAAIKAAGDSKQAETTAKTMLEDAKKALETAKADVETVKKNAADSLKANETTLASIAKQLKDAGTDAPKIEDALAKFVTAKKDADAQSKALGAQLQAAMKKESDLTTAVTAAKSALDQAQKAATDAQKARDASETTLRAFADRLEKAKLIGPKADNTSILRAIDDAIKSSGGDAVKTVREDLVKARELAGKLQADLATATAKEAEAAKNAATAKADLARVTAEAQKSKADLAVASKNLSDADAKFKAQSASIVAARDAALKTADELRKDRETYSTEAARLKSENATIKAQLQAALDSGTVAVAQPNPGGAPTILRIDPVQIADRSFGDGVKAFFAGNYGEAESALSKAIARFPDDARYHYLLGLSVLQNSAKPGISEQDRLKRQAEAKSHFEKGRDLEIRGLPNLRAVNSALERIQGDMRREVNAYRP